MKDVQLDPEAESAYECFSCGTVVHATAPGSCPKCGADMRNRRTPIE
ncbi:rubrerythrin-like domain-containing protein [Natrarchaeobius halalkaliphilus]|uniref:Rubrerythrin-like domain-containing protein n=1 Tax=Natrarchaeobius halalkaliphilus TaxID=1679091 RepID=A0A3N6P3Y9_9EURY|nr:rubrerythrin-like domain-containing protein [Natrarchaeobius halalkaliphilus]RQG90085.1 rubrerythrin-like domain-containing protein [Natrarchaeobius halalkaliphilus]